MKCIRCESIQIVQDFENPDFLICENCELRTPNTVTATAKHSLTDVHYQELMKFSPNFRKISRMRRDNLINAIARKLYYRQLLCDSRTIREHAIQIALKRLGKIELSYWLYKLDY